VFTKVTANDADPVAERAPVADLPTRHGLFRLHVVSDGATASEHVAVVLGNVLGQERVATRIRSECLTGDAFGSLRCDRREQLDRGLERLAARDCGGLLYRRQEGRGIGVANKVRAYRLQQGRRLDGVRSGSLMTNNIDKITQLSRAGIPAVARIPHVMEPGPLNQTYLETKARPSGHLLYPNGMPGA
jgi:GTP cyclohydrolase II